ncbi:hypothetical protein BDP81DRAFT_515542 [Colletotrichum phormii]|uniref:2EXR domain-containing protein n=1 Tax=Colletotrichum phormii TaxID=359342 RepID=A0AAJ0EIF0_9PEZI|nr:uncharacterized protein BDP81DRAFT_515542 [Colletotrichum phormii]KAK1638021.1 hypothetical protein BDP81DRAFT_515542 [Colletotrichum phormii]
MVGVMEGNRGTTLPQLPSMPSSEVANRRRLKVNGSQNTLLAIHPSILHTHTFLVFRITHSAQLTHCLLYHSTHPHTLYSQPIFKICARRCNNKSSKKSPAASEMTNFKTAAKAKADTQVEVEAPADSFHQFAKFPCEVQIMVWEEFYLEPRHFYAVIHDFRRPVKGKGNRLDREEREISKLHLRGKDESISHYNAIDNQINYLSREIARTIRHKVRMRRLEDTDQGLGFDIEVHNRQTSRYPDFAYLNSTIDVLHLKAPLYRMSVSPEIAARCKNIEHAIVECTGSEDPRRTIDVMCKTKSKKRNGKWRLIFSGLKSLETVFV